MTRNQLEYWKLQHQREHDRKTRAENERSNRERERETMVHNRLTEAESARSNLAREAETARSNKSQEILTNRRDSETARHNLAQEVENQRANRAREAETARSNLATEALSQQRNLLTQREIAEKERYNQASESLTLRAQNEAIRSNIASEQIRSDQVGAQYAGVQATLASIQEQQRHAMATEAETYRSNVAKETNARAETSNKLVLGNKQHVEQVRHNKASEKIQLETAGIHGVASLLNTGLKGIIGGIFK